MSRKPPLVAAAVFALMLAARGTASLDDRYEPLLAMSMYARGERAAALLGLAQISEKEQIRKFERYEPEGVAREGWHRIEVRLPGKKGQVQTRRGYWVAR